MLIPTYPAESTRVRRRRWLSLSVLVLAALVLSVDATVLYLAIPSLTAELAPSATQVLWIGDIYSLALAGLLVPMGNLADKVGRKRLLLVGTVAFGVASLTAALATSPEMLVAGRALLGISGAAIMPSTLSIIRATFEDDRERTRAIAIWSAATAGGSAMGPIVGGALLEHFWWGSVFLINVPIMAVVLIAGMVLLAESRDPEAGAFDLLSAALSFGSLVPIVWAIKRSVTVEPGVDVLGVLVVGTLAGWLFVRRQRRARNPMIDVSLFRDASFSGTVLANFIGVFALTGLLFFFSQYLQLVKGFSPLVAGIAEAPGTIGGILGIFVIGFALDRFGVGRTLAAALVLISLGLALVAVAEAAASYLWLALAVGVLGVGAGISQTVATDAVVAAVPVRKAGAAASISETAFELGTAFGIAIMGSTVTALYRSNLTGVDWSSEGDAEEANESLASALQVLPRDSDQAQAAVAAFTDAMQGSALLAAGALLLAALIVRLRVGSRPRDRAAVEDRAPASVGHQGLTSGRT